MTDLRVSKSASVRYSPSTATFTATVLNDEGNFIGQACPILLVRPGLETVASMNRVSPGTWTYTGEIGSVGLLEFCVLSETPPLCNGPSVSVEVLSQELPLVSLSSVPNSPVLGGDTVSISVRIRSDYTDVDKTRSGIRLKAGSLEGQCGVLSLSSGDERDGVWTGDCVVPLRPPETENFEATIEIVVWGVYSDSSTLEYRFEVL